MKKIQIIMMAIGLAVGVTACYRSHGRHVTIETSVNRDTKLKIEYSGRIVFTDDSMGISSMAPNCYFKYKRNDEKLEAQSDASGHILYELNGDGRVSALSNDGKRLLAEAVRQVVKAQRKGRG